MIMEYTWNLYLAPSKNRWPSFPCGEMATLEVLNISLPASNIIIKPIDSIELRTKSLQAYANKRKAIWLNFFSFNWLHIGLFTPRRFDNGLGKEHGLRMSQPRWLFILIWHRHDGQCLSNIHILNILQLQFFCKQNVPLDLKTASIWVN